MSMSVAVNTPIEELVLEDVIEVCSEMSNEVEFVPHQSDCPDFASHQNKVPLESASVATRGSRRDHNNYSVFSIKSHQESFTNAPFCSFVTSDIKLISFSGRKHHTNSVTFVPGDMAIWRYANNILKAVLIQSVCPPSQLLPGFWYSFKMLTDENMMHDTWHDNLFIPVLDGNVMHDKKGIFNFREELFTMKDHLLKHINPSLPSKHLLHFNWVTSDGFSTKHFLAGLATLGCLFQETISDHSNRFGPL